MNKSLEKPTNKQLKEYIKESRIMYYVLYFTGLITFCILMNMDLGRDGLSIFTLLAILAFFFKSGEIQHKIRLEIRELKGE